MRLQAIILEYQSVGGIYRGGRLVDEKIRLLADQVGDLLHGLAVVLLVQLQDLHLHYQLGDFLQLLRFFRVHTLHLHCLFLNLHCKLLLKLVHHQVGSQIFCTDIWNLHVSLIGFEFVEVVPKLLLQLFDSFDILLVFFADFDDVVEDCDDLIIKLLIKILIVFSNHELLYGVLVLVQNQVVIKFIRLFIVYLLLFLFLFQSFIKKRTHFELHLGVLQGALFIYQVF